MLLSELVTEKNWLMQCVTVLTKAVWTNEVVRSTPAPPYLQGSVARVGTKSLHT